MTKGTGRPDSAGQDQQPASIAEWLIGLGFARYVQAFRDNHIDQHLLLDLDDNDLRQLGVVSLGHRKQLMRAIGELRPVPCAPVPVAADAERRQLTVMFIDLVGSTALAAQMDPEDMRALLQDFNATVQREIEHFDGFIAKFLGDGALVYFGWPRAHEDEAQRAVRAGLAVVGAVARLRGPDGEPLQAHAGIATGVVVVGDVLGGTDSRERAVVGETPNLAARMQALARPGQVVIADSTLRLLDQAFEVEDLGPQDIKGIEEPVPAYRVVIAADDRDRFAARAEAGLSPMVGRQRELAALRGHWHRAAAGDGHMVLLTGEAGIGKSRTLHALFDALRGEDYTRIRCQGSPFHADSVLWPVIRHIRVAADVRQDDSNDVKLDKLEALVRQANDDPVDDVRAVASLLGICCAPRYEPIDLPPQAKRQVLLKTLVRQMLGLARRRPLLIVAEDIHWFDPTSLEALDRLLGFIGDAPILVVATSRPDALMRLPLWEDVPRIELGRLAQDDVAAMIARLCNDQPLTDTTIETIVERTDGVPLYIEEVTKAILEAGRDLSQVPATLRDSLIARLDRLPDVKNVAQIAGCIGREFDFALLSQVVDIDDAHLTEALGRLLDAELVFRRSGQRRDAYVFKHALVRDVAYESLLKERRRQVHARIAGVLEARPAADLQREPEVLAHHFDLAGDAAKALEYWLAACRRAAERSAHHEAVAHAMRGLACLGAIAPSTERDTQELDLVMAYGSSLLALKGWAAPQVHELYTRAAALAAELGRECDEFIANWNLWLINSQSGNIPTARKLVDRVTALSNRLDDRQMCLQAHHAGWASLLQSGDLSAVLDHVDHGLVLYDADADRYGWARYGGHDAAVCGHGHSAWVQWMRGRADAALHSVDQAQQIAEQLDHPYSQLITRFHRCTILFYRRDVDGLLDEAVKANRLAEAHELQQHAGLIRVMHGWAQAAQGDLEGGLRDTRAGLALLHELGIRVRRTKYLAIAAEVCLMAGRLEEGLQRVDDGLRLSETIFEIRWRPELLRLKAGLLQAGGGTDAAAQDMLLRQAIAESQAQGTIAFELRASRDLALRQADLGERGQALDLLQTVYAGFTEGLDTPDLTETAEMIRAWR